MPIESVTYISDLNASNPVGSTDKVQTLDDHIRLIKSAVKATFPNVAGEVAPTHTELNYLDGATGVTGTGNTVRSASPTFTGTVTAATVAATTLTGAGSGITALNASNLGSGTVPDARFPATLPALNGSALTALNASNLGSGTVPDARFPATLPAASGANLTSLNGSNVASGTVADARLSSQVVLKDTAISSVDNGDAADPGYRGVPANSQSGNYTCVLADAGKHILYNGSGSGAHTLTIPANASVAYPVGTVLTFVNFGSSGTVLIGITSDTMYLAGSVGTTGTRTLANVGVATAVKVASTSWIISGGGLS